MAIERNTFCNVQSLRNNPLSTLSMECAAVAVNKQRALCSVVFPDKSKQAEHANANERFSVLTTWFCARYCKQDMHELQGPRSLEKGKEFLFWPLTDFMQWSESCSESKHNCVLIGWFCRVAWMYLKSVAPHACLLILLCCMGHCLGVFIPHLVRIFDHPDGIEKKHIFSTFELIPRVKFQF